MRCVVEIKKEDIISSSIQLEIEGRKFYLEIAEKTTNPVMKSMFKSFAQDELAHIEWFKKLSPEVKSLSESKENFYKYLSSIFMEIPQNEKREASASQDDIKAINIAIEMERKSQVAYNKWAEAVKNEELKNLLLMISDIEKFHEQVLENSKEFLEKPGDWFMQQERWIFEG